MPSDRMQIESVLFRDFRNYEHLELDGLGPLTIFVGRNAIGKTNILEGIQLLTSASSFRNPQISQLIRDGAEISHIQMVSTDGNRRIETSLLLEAGKRRYTVNGKAKQTVDVRGVLPSIIFTPDDLQLAKKSSSIKRTALDDLGVQLTRNYYIVRRDYEKALRYKNRLLKDEASRALIQSINETMVMCGAQLYCYRYSLFNRMIPHVARVYSEISGNSEAFAACYRPSWDRVSDKQDPGAVANTISLPENGTSRDEVRELMAFHLEKMLDEEVKRKRALIGPHNDEITFTLDGRDASSFASQGQQRCIVLAWKLSEVQLTREITDISPVLLLDDVLSELDESRREMLVEYATADVQTFVTATDLAGFHDDLIDRAQVIELPLVL